jgi:hypothetical protein
VSLVTFFGTSSALNAGAGYSTSGTTGDTGIFGMRFKIFGETDTAAIGVRFYSAGTLTGAWAYLFDASEPAAVIAAKQITITAGWNEVRFDNAALLNTLSFGYIAAVYLPNGGYPFKAHVFDVSTSDIPSADDPSHLFAIPNATRGNGVFFSGVQSDPAHPVVSSWNTFNATSYAVDVLAFDPSVSGGTLLAPAPVVDPVVTGAPTTGNILSSTNGTWIGDPTITYALQWTRDGTDIAGQTGSTYSLVTADEGHSIACRVTATNGAGSTPRSSNALSASAPAVGATVTQADLLVPVDGQWMTLKVTYEPGLRPEEARFGAIGDDVADDTDAITACVSEAVTSAVNNGSFYAEVQFDRERYKLSSPTAKGGAGQGNAQIPLPVVVPESSQKLTLKFKGYNTGSCMHWAQTESLKMGTVLRSTLTGQSVDGTWGFPSIIGGPAGQVGTNPLAPWYSNLHMVFDGVSVMAPQNPSFMAIDGRGVAQLTLKDLFVTVDATPSDLSASPPTNSNGIGVYWPSPGNNAVLDCDNVTVQGYFLHMGLAEHFVASRLLLLHGNRSFYFAGTRAGHAGSTTNHSISIQYACVEAVQTVIQMDPNAADLVTFSIAELDLELIGSTQPHFADAANKLVGDIGWNDYQLATPRMSGTLDGNAVAAGGKNLRIIDRKTPRGASSLTLPATGAAGAVLWRDRRIHIGGGTLTGVTVDGVALPDVPRAFDVPSGRPWSIAYTGSPTAAQVAV